MKVADCSIKWQVTSEHISLGKTMVPVRVTKCHIHKGVSTESGFASYSGFGKAFCSPKDNFQKNKGRKIALVRALEKIQLNKRERREIWEAYRDMTPTRRW